MQDELRYANLNVVMAHLELFPQAVHELCPALLCVLLLVDPHLPLLGKLGEALSQLQQKPERRDWLSAPFQVYEQILGCQSQLMPIVYCRATRLLQQSI